MPAPQYNHSLSSKRRYPTDSRLHSVIKSPNYNVPTGSPSPSPTPPGYGYSWSGSFNGRALHLRLPTRRQWIWPLVTTFGSSYTGGPGQPIRITSWGIIDQGTYALNLDHRRCTMRVSQAVDFHLHYHRPNSKKKYGQDQ